ncbi:hypothetical protein, partial [Escherichia coli]|uniref:hypothetical protein n=1 Tax=Escherichia coli TaxID=562 RepID=UPI001BC85D13
MDNILLIFTCLFIGLALQKVREFPNSGYKILNLFIVYAALPGLALYFIPKIELSARLLFPLAVGW